tara:strand:+ start:790 stop:2808 length:2019 start_codon:yes stop_codon:yes gene_type:complete
MATTQENRIIFSIEFTEKGAIRKIDGVTTSVKKFDSELKKATLANKQFNQTLSGRESMTTNAGLAGATLTELGRTISDLPYGIRGVANNLSQLSTLFTTMVAKVDDNVKGFARVGRAVKMLRTQLMGPLGIVLAFQAVIAALDFFVGGAKKAEEATDSLAEAMKKREGLRESVFVFAEILKDTNSTIEEQQLALAKLQKEGFDDTKGSLEDFIEAYKIKQDLDVEDEKRGKKIEELTGKRTEQLDIIAKKESELATKRIDIENEEDERRLRALLFQEKGIEQQIKNAETSLATTEASISAINAAFKNGIEDITNDPAIKNNPFYASLIGLKVKKDAAGEEDPVQGSVASIAKAIKELEKLRDETATTGKEFDSFAIKIKALQDELEALQGVQERDEVEFVNAFKKREEEKDETLKEYFIRQQRRRNSEDKAKEEIHKKELGRIKQEFDKRNELADNIKTAVTQLSQVQDQAFTAQTQRLDTERDIILNNDNLTSQEKERLLKKNDSETRKVRTKQIKFERDMMQIEMAMELFKIGLKMKNAMTTVMVDASGAISKSTMSIGAFMNQLGPFGIAAYAASIGGVIATIVSARKKAKQQIQSLSNQSLAVGGGGGGSSPSIQAPAFNVVGATQESQLAQAISGADSKPLKAFVVASDISTAQELELSKIEGASIG